MTKKMNLFYCFIYSFAIFVVSSFILTIIQSIFQNEAISYNISNVVCIAILYAIYRKKIKTDFKNFKDDFKNIFPKVFIVSIILLAVETALATIFGNLGIDSPNQSYAIDLIKSNTIPMIIYCAITTPIFEELCFRLPYHYSTNNKVLTFIVYSVVFTSTHLLGVSELSSLLYIIPYLLLAFGIGYPFYKSDNIIMSTIVHIINNSLAIMLILL